LKAVSVVQKTEPQELGNKIIDPAHLIDLAQLGNEGRNKRLADLLMVLEDSFSLRLLLLHAKESASTGGGDPIR
jgi:hypothetical protein